MKRKGNKKAPKVDDDSNGVEDNLEENGAVSDVDEDDIDEPKNKKRKSKSNRKNVSFSPKKGENATVESDPLEDVGELKKPKDKKKKGKELKSESGHEGEDDVSEPKKKKKGKESKVESSEEDEDAQDEDDESQYEVEKILDEKMIKGIRHYLIRWKGYEEESDTWEPEDTLNCSEIIADYKENKKKNKVVKKEKVKKEKKDDDVADWDENEDFEVDRILEVHHKRDGKREFLVSWKGFSAKDNSWEPEENMNCKDLIERFMTRVKQAKNFDEKELRVNRKQVQRFTYNTPDSNRRLSRRMQGKERVQYHDTE